MCSRGTSEGGRASCVRGAVRCAYLARMVEHDEARQDPHHEEAHITRLVACERRHTKGLGGVSHGALQWRGEEVAPSWAEESFFTPSDETAIHTRQGGDLTRQGGDLPTSTVAVKGEAKVGKVR